MIGFVLFTTASRAALGPTQPHIQLIPGACTSGVKRPGRESDRAEVTGDIPPVPYTSSWRGALLNTETTLAFVSVLKSGYELRTCN
jgi:hypothetical protein